MFLVNGMKKANCEANEKHTDVECYLVECQSGTFSGPICPKCFIAQVRMRSKKMAARPATVNGDHIPTAILDPVEIVR